MVQQPTRSVVGHDVPGVPPPDVQLWFAADTSDEGTCTREQLPIDG